MEGCREGVVVDRESALAAMHFAPSTILRRRTTNVR